MAVLLTILGTVLGCICAAVLVFAVYESGRARRQRQAFLRLRNDTVSHQAAAEVVSARAEFGQAVEEYEEAMTGAQRTIDVTSGAGSVAISGGSGGLFESVDAPPVQAGPSIADLEHRKDEARARLMNAQRAWEAVRPSSGPSSTLDLWSGNGVLRGWQFGPIGFERAFIRCEHVVDPDCWAAWEVKRLRLGFAFGAEEQRLALFAAAVPIDRMTEIVGRAMGGTEVALRPGFAPLRWWRRNRRIPAARRATYSLLTTRELDHTTDDATRFTVRSAIETELGQSIDDIRELGDVDGVLSVLAAGPSVALGFWTGRSPAAEMLAASPHTSWHATS